MFGVALGAWGYRYFIEQGQRIPGTEPLDEQARRLAERAKAFAESGRQLAEEGRQLAQAARATAQTAIDVGQERGRAVVNKARARTAGWRESAERVREDVHEGEAPQDGG
jgi:hypothetical protein